MNVLLGYFKNMVIAVLEYGVASLISQHFIITYFSFDSYTIQAGCMTEAALTTVRLFIQEPHQV